MGKYLPIIKIAQCGSFNKAAGELGYSQPNLWHIVNNLEDDLGTKLFHRSRQGVTLTDAGKQLLEKMERIEAQESSLYQYAQNYKANQVRVGLFPALTGRWTADLLAALKAEYPALHVKLENPETYQGGLRAVTDQGLDCCFSILPGSAEVEAIPLWEEPYYLVVGAEHPLAAMEEVLLQDVMGKYPLLSNSDSFDPDSPLWPVYRRTEHVFMADSAPMDPLLSVALAKKGLGVALLPQTMSEGATEGVRWIPLAEKLSRPVTLLYSGKGLLSSYVESMVRLMSIPAFGHHESGVLGITIPV